MDLLTDRLTRPGSPFELVPGATGSSRVFRHAPQSLQAVFHKAARSSTRTCMSVAGRPICFEQILKEAWALAFQLTRVHGAAAGTRIALVATDSPAWLAAFAAITLAHGVIVIIDRNLGAVATLAALDAAGCEIVLTDRECGRQLCEGGDRRTHIAIRDGADWADGHYFEGVDTADARGLGALSMRTEPEEDALVAFTSGSTGKPKGVVSTHRAVLTGMMNTLLAGALGAARERNRSGPSPTARDAPCSLLLSPFSHVGGYSHLVLMTHIAGKVVPRSCNGGSLLERITQEKVTVLSGATPPILKELLAADLSSHDLSSLSAMSLYGLAPVPRMIREMQAHLPSVRIGTGYGLTETNGTVCASSGTELLERPGVSGPVLPSVEARIRDESGSDVPAGCAGEIWIRGPMLMRAYVYAGRERAAAIRDGWFCTDDNGWLDAEGYLYVTERRQDVFWNAGTRISCAGIVQLIHDENLAEDAAALAVDRSGRQPQLIVAVVPHPHPDSTERLSRYLREATLLEADQLTILKLERMPRTTSGKPDRTALSRLAKIHSPAG